MTRDGGTLSTPLPSPGDFQAHERVMRWLWATRRETRRDAKPGDENAHSGLPPRVVVGANGAYWRDYGDHYSICPTSDDNDPVEAVAIYVNVATLPEPTS